MIIQVSQNRVTNALYNGLVIVYSLPDHCLNKFGPFKNKTPKIFKSDFVNVSVYQRQDRNHPVPVSDELINAVKATVCQGSMSCLIYVDVKGFIPENFCNGHKMIYGKHVLIWSYLSCAYLPYIDLIRTQFWKYVLINMDFIMQMF